MKTANIDPLSIKCIILTLACVLGAILCEIMPCETLSYTNPDTSTPYTRYIAHKPVHKETIYDKITKYSLKYHIRRSTLDHIVKHESRYNPKAKGDMDIICERTGKPVEAKGLTQITTCFHPEVTRAQAYDPDFALDWTARRLRDGKCHEWSTCPL